MLICMQVVSQGIEGSAFSHLWLLISDVLRLSADVFKTIPTLSYSLPAALLVVFAAGFFQSLSQIVVLFINQVRPLRFVLSLLISALFSVVGYGFWALSTWSILSLVFDAQLSFLEMLRTLGFSYAPLAVFGATVMLPYFGGGIFVVLSIWTLLALVVGLESLTEMSRWDAFASGVLGWVVLQLLQKTVGQPIASLGQWITNWAAGEELITNRIRLAQELYSGLRAQSASIDRLDAISWQKRDRSQGDRSQGAQSQGAQSQGAQLGSQENKSASKEQKGQIVTPRAGTADIANAASDDLGRDTDEDVAAASRQKRSRRSLSQAILSRSFQDARERLRAENREQDR